MSCLFSGDFCWLQQVKIILKQIFVGLQDSKNFRETTSLAVQITRDLKSIQFSPVDEVPWICPKHGLKKSLKTHPTADQSLLPITGIPHNLLAMTWWHPSFARGFPQWYSPQRGTCQRGGRDSGRICLAAGWHGDMFGQSRVHQSIPKSGFILGFTVWWTQYDGCHKELVTVATVPLSQEILQNQISSKPPFSAIWACQCCAFPKIIVFFWGEWCQH